MQTFVRLISAVGGLVMLSACASKEPPKVTLEQSAGALLGQYTTYAWRSPAPEGDPRWPSSPMHRDWLIRSTVDHLLAAKGYTRTSDHPGFLVDYEVVDKQKETSSFQDFYSYKEAGGSKDMIDAFTIGYSEGVLLLGIFDGSTQQLVWRTRTTVLLDQKDSDARIAVALRYMLARWPNCSGS